VWDEGASYVSSQPGFIAAWLHRAVSTDAPFDFCTIAA
jgi:hypothetical protein